MRALRTHLNHCIEVIEDIIELTTLICFRLDKSYLNNKFLWSLIVGCPRVCESKNRAVSREEALFCRLDFH